MNASALVPQDRIGARAPLLFALIILIGFGFLYATMAALAGGALFPAQAEGSLLRADGRVVGSSLLAQPFADARYFHPRPSAANYDPMAAAGSNQARSHPDLRTRIDAARTAVAAREGVAADAVPAELITQSGGGFDPHLSRAAIEIQIARVANARGMDAATLRALVERHSEGRQFGLLGQERINVLTLNLALDAAP
jgi:K+-transporting ATPase ATPase C chain